MKENNITKIKYKESPKVKEKKLEELALITEYKTELVTERVLEEGIYKYKQYKKQYQTQRYGKIYKEEG